MEGSIESNRGNPNVLSGSTEDLRDNLSQGIDTNLENRELHETIYSIDAYLEALSPQFVDGFWEAELDGLETEEAQNKLTATRNLVQSLDNLLTDLDALMSFDRDDNGDYINAAPVVSGDIEVDPEFVQSEIDRFLEVLDSFEPQEEEPAQAATEVPQAIEKPEDQRTVEQPTEAEVEKEIEEQVAAVVEEAQQTQSASPQRPVRTTGTTVAPAAAAAATTVATTNTSRFRPGTPMYRLSQAIEGLKQQVESMGNQFKQMWNNVLRTFGFEVEDDVPFYAESRDIDIDPSLIENSYELTEAEVAGLSPEERTYAERIAEYAGLPISRIDDLASYSSASRLSRVELYKYVSEMAEACVVYGIPTDVGLPLMVSSGIIESRMNPMADIDDDGDSHKGFFQFKDEYWEGTFEDIRPELERYGVIDTTNQSFDVMGSMYDSRIQCFAMAESMNSKLSRLGGTWRSYDQSILARDLYLTHNLGFGHSWMIGYLNGDITTDQLLDMFENRNGNRATLPNGEEVTFKNYALRKSLLLVEGRNSSRVERYRAEGYGRTFEDQTWNKAQNHYNNVREILYGRH